MFFFFAEPGSSVHMSVSWSLTKQKKKRQFHMNEHSRWWNWMLPGKVPLVTEAKNEGGNKQFRLSRMALDSMRRYSCDSEGWQGKRATAMEPVSHEVVKVLGVAAIQLRKVKVAFHLCFETASRHDAFLLLLSFILLWNQIQAISNVNLTHDQFKYKKTTTERKEQHLLFLVSVFH